MHITVDGVAVSAANGEYLSEVLRRAGVSVPHPCGGRGTCGKCRVLVDGKEELSCQYRIHGSVTVVTQQEGDILSETGASTTERVVGEVCFALDIGTTTLALAAVSTTNGEIVRTVTCKNPQRIFGADVMTRIDYCRKHGPHELAAVLITEVNRMIGELGERAQTLYVAGNTTMLHLFFGVDCSSMGVAPYTPVFLESRRENAAALGITGVREVISLPSIAAFVGADIVAGLDFVKASKAGRYSLLIDLGTNAEVVLFSGESALCTAAAAGPCFEGANISCGMSATAGAIYAYDAGKAKTVGDLPPRGVCGTGLVDMIAALIKDGTVDETGFMECERFEVAPQVYITQEDIRQYQLAKSAVCAAVLTLMSRKQVTFDDIAVVYISGGFSAGINIDNAVKTGLLPPELQSKCRAIYNSSLLGAARFAAEQNDLSQYTRSTEYVDLSADPLFSELFVQNMLFSEE